MAPAAVAAPQGSSLKTEKGLSELNDFLADRTYVGGDSHSVDDLTRFKAIGVPPDRSRFPHLARWHRHISALAHTYADYYSWPGDSVSSTAAPSGGDKAPKGRAPGKEKQVLVIDCKPIPVADTKIPSKSPPPLGTGGTTTCKKNGQFYITTAITYANGWPHIGHAYEAMTTDVFARYHRVHGKDTFFLTGSDEHGQKIAQHAEEQGMTPQQGVDKYADSFKALNQRLTISNDRFIRTTDADHKETARALWRKCKEKGDIYVGNFEGWYLVREERFITDLEAKEMDYKDPGNGQPLKKMSEPSYFFRLTKYKDAILQYMKDNPTWIRPEQYRTEIIERLSSYGDDVRDLSISRATFSWGVPCPEDVVDGQEHVMYVWFDALINYISGVHGNDAKHPLSRFWPADVHVIGKDISWFHTVIWGTMLMSCEIPLPKHILIHGFVSGPDGRKMSKTYGNVVNPHDMLDKYSSDTLRWFLARAGAYGDDVKFSEEALKLMHNADLCANLGNLVQRAVKLGDGTVPECDKKLVQIPFDLAELKKSFDQAMKDFALQEAANLAVGASGATNKWIADLEPWKMKDADKQPLKVACLRFLLEAVYVLAHFFAPFIPVAADAIFKKLSHKPVPITDLKNDFMNLKSGTKLIADSVLFQPIEVGDSGEAAPKAEAKAKAKSEPKAAAKAAATKAGAKAAAGKAGKQKVVEEEDPNQPLFTKLDVRVGHVVKAWHHPDAEKLFCEEIDVGEEAPRVIVSGLREHYTQEAFQGMRILVVCNMQPSKLRGVTSHGMVLCAKNLDKKVVELLAVPKGCKVGDRVLPEGDSFDLKPLQPATVKKNEVWERIAKELKTDGDRLARFEGRKLVTASGEQFLAPTQANMPIA
eukprot:TRINITY_DN7766_c0_g1_i1.p1 TRINITY_DN7766_c0_g1~~TRINITY_DN7766_c0_g1_i1.p1  ORF type:complete len:873 (+),score=259.72 TRINITY_DN7766_c0_g1_i1:89-2707(+)